MNDSKQCEKKTAHVLHVLLFVYNPPPKKKKKKKDLTQ